MTAAPVVVDSGQIGLLTISEAAEVAGVSPATVRSWVLRYRLPTVRVDGRVMLGERALYECERARRRDGRGPRRAARDARG